MGDFWVRRVLAGTPIWDIGQLDRRTVKRLNRLVEKGDLECERVSWMSISRPKKVWFRPGYEPLEVLVARYQRERSVK